MIKDIVDKQYTDIGIGKKMTKKKTKNRKPTTDKPSGMNPEDRARILSEAIREFTGFEADLKLCHAKILRLALLWDAIHRECQPANNREIVCGFLDSAEAINKTLEEIRREL